MQNLTPFEIDHSETKRNIQNLWQARNVSIRTLLDYLNLTDPADLFQHLDIGKVIALAKYFNVPLSDLLVLKNPNSSADSAQ